MYQSMDERAPLVIAASLAIVAGIIGGLVVIVMSLT